MLKKEAIDTIARHRGDALSVVTMQAAAPWHDIGQGRVLNVDASGCMGSAASLGLGLAMGCPQKKVLVLDGDGSLLMQLGSLVTISGESPPNLYHFVFVNGLYESSGNQPIPALGKFRFTALATAAGYAQALQFSRAHELDAALPQVLASKGPVLIELEIARDDAPTRWPGVPMAKMVEDVRQALAPS
jgi:sulfopyruvate decarboxylase subunit beta